MENKMSLTQAWNIVVSTSRQYKGTADEWDAIHAALVTLKGVVEPLAQQEVQPQDSAPKEE